MYDPAVTKTATGVWAYILNAYSRTVGAKPVNSGYLSSEENCY